MSSTPIRVWLRRAFLALVGSATVFALVTPAWMLYGPVLAERSWRRDVERARDLWGEPAFMSLDRYRRGRHAWAWWSTSFGTARLEPFRTEPFFLFRNELLLDFGRSAIDEGALAEARRILPGITIDVRHSGGRWERR